MSAYLVELTLRLAHGSGCLPDAERAAAAHYFHTAQQPDGGFRGRDGGSDLYYTGFALRALSILGVLEGAPAERAADFVRGKLAAHESIVDFFSLIYAGQLLQASAGIDVFSRAGPAWRANVAAALERLRRDDGGYAKGFEGHRSSTYHTFLVVLCLQLLQQPIPDPEKIVQFLQQRQTDEGGFLEISVGKRAGSNPTAAAIGTLRILDALDAVVVADTIEFLLELQTPDGGFQANTRIPFADLLSTFTSTLTLVDLQAAERLDLPRIQRFVRGLRRDAGGYHAGSFDPSHDVEYSFYGLGCEALLAGLAAP